MIPAGKVAGLRKEIARFPCGNRFISFRESAIPWAGIFRYMDITKRRI